MARWSRRPSPRSRSWRVYCRRKRCCRHLLEGRAIVVWFLVAILLELALLLALLLLGLVQLLTALLLGLAWPIAALLLELVWLLTALQFMHVLHPISQSFWCHHVLLPAS